MEVGCSGAVLLVQDGGVPKILLGKRAANRSYYPGVWDVPGGHVEPDETPEATLIRELGEEIGVVPTHWELLGELTPVEASESASDTLYLFVVTEWNGTPSNCLPEEHSELSWFPIADACQLELAHPGYPSLFRKAVATVLPASNNAPEGRNSDFCD